MKTILSGLISLLMFSLGARAAIQVPGADGSDGVLNITVNTEIDLSLAVPGTWDQPNGANEGKGVYDPAQWVVVFKYSSVTVAAGATVTFKNHASRAPVMWLVNGPVTINGIVNVNGQDCVVAPALAEPGPGGFRGGTGSYLSTPKGGAGFGPGGGLQATNDRGQGGAFGTGVVGSSAPYGNPSLIPLLGGSGGAGDPEIRNTDRRGGGAGGGALLIASTGTVTIASTGEVRANGGAGKPNLFDGEETGGGAGGGIRVVCDTLAGSGKLSASGGSGVLASGVGGLGRIRVERVTNSSTLLIAPDPSVVPLNASDTAIIVPPTGAPEVRIVSIGGVNTPTDPRAGFGAVGADVTLAETTSTQIVIETKNIEQQSQVQVRLTPRANANATVINATVSNVAGQVVTWTANVTGLNVGYAAVQVKVVRP